MSEAVVEERQIATRSGAQAARADVEAVADATAVEQSKLWQSSLSSATAALVNAAAAGSGNIIPGLVIASGLVMNVLVLAVGVLEGDTFESMAITSTVVLGGLITGGILILAGGILSVISRSLPSRQVAEHANVVANAASQAGTSSYQAALDLRRVPDPDPASKKSNSA